MSAILSVDDLNDFISPGVACIKPMETLPKQQTAEVNAYEVTTEDKVAAENAPPASISLTDCLACSGCVTSAEAVLVSLQSHAEVLNTLDAYPELPLPMTISNGSFGSAVAPDESLPEPDIAHRDGKIFVASISPQTRASIAATYNVTLQEAGNMITQLLSGPLGLRSGGAQNSGFTYVLDTNTFRQIALVSAADEIQSSIPSQTNGSLENGLSREDAAKNPILASACPGWICYAEKTHPHVLPHISRLKSPQALAGTLIKSVLARRFGIDPTKIWHLAVMPCFDKKLEASREELTDIYWDTPNSKEAKASGRTGVRDVDCVITARELLMLAEARNISFPLLPRTRLSRHSGRVPFPDPILNSFLFPKLSKSSSLVNNSDPAAGTSGGYLHHILHTQLHTLRTSRTSPHPNAILNTIPGRNIDVVDYEIVDPDTAAVLFRSARYYGFRNIQNLVRRLKPAKVSRLPGAAARGGARRPGGAAAAAVPSMTEYAFVEVMACPGGCTNGGGQIKVGDVGLLRQGMGSGVENGSAEQVVLPAQKEWLARVDEAYFSGDASSTPSDDDDADDDDEDEMDLDIHNNSSNTKAEEEKEEDLINGISHSRIHALVAHWSAITAVDAQKLVYTSYREVESDVGKSASAKKGKSAGVSDVERVAGLAASVGGGW